MSTSLRFGSTASTPQMAAMASVAERQLTARQSPTPDSQQSAPNQPFVVVAGDFRIWRKADEATTLPKFDWTSHTAFLRIPVCSSQSRAASRGEVSWPFAHVGSKGLCDVVDERCRRQLGNSPDWRRNPLLYEYAIKIIEIVLAL